MKQDLDEKFLSQFDNLKKKVDDFNKSLDKFKESDLENLVSNYLKDEGFEITKNMKNNPSSNTIIIENILSPLKSFWFKNTPFEIVQWDKENLLRIDSSVIALSSCENERKRITDTIEKIKNCESIIKETNYFKEEPKRISDEGQKLAKEIEYKIVKKVENEEYDTTCNICKKLNDF
jgi:hypothetical protein